MTFEVSRWLKISKDLKGFKLAFLCASLAHKKQISNLVKSTSIFLLPYPIISTQRITKPLDEKINLVYAGRITPSKNALSLMKIFLFSMKHHDHTLHIAGNFHDRGYHFHGLKLNFESFKKKFYNYLDMGKGRIIYHGELEQLELMKLFDTTDYFISLSTYQDEDFGVSSIQALSRGNNLILSDWGGHKDHVNLKYDFKISTFIKDKPEVKLNLKKLLKIFLKSLQKNSQENKAIRIAEFEAKYSPKAFLTQLERISMQEIQPYRGQSELFQSYSTKFLDTNGAPYSSIHYEVDHSASLFKKIYNCYCSDQS